MAVVVEMTYQYISTDPTQRSRLSLALFLKLAAIAALVLWYVHSRPSPPKVLGQGQSLPASPPPAGPSGERFVARSPQPAPAVRLPPTTIGTPQPEYKPLAQAAADAGSFADPFEWHGQQEPVARTLLAVGDVQLGVLSDVRIHDEPGLLQALARVGEKLDRQSRELGRGGIQALQQILDDERDELGRYMEGELELRGPHWMIGLEVGPPRTIGDGWQTRPY